MNLLLKFFLFLEKTFGTRILGDIAWSIAWRIEVAEIKVGDIVGFTRKSNYNFTKNRKGTLGKVVKIQKNALYPYCVKILNNKDCFLKKQEYLFTRKEIKKIKPEKIKI